VPWPYAAQQVWLRPSRGTHLLVRNQHGAEIARHALARRKGITTLDPAHYVGLPGGGRGGGGTGGRSDQPRTKALLAHVFLQRFPDHGAFVDGLVAQQYNNAGKHLRVVLALAEVYSAEAMQAALTAAREYNAYSHRFIRGLLEASDATRVTRRSNAGGPVGTLERVASLPSSLPPRAAMVTERVTADLHVYQRLLEAAR
jgi:hypothetical protein